MNWQELKKYPKAWELFGDFVYCTIGNYNVELPETFNSEYVNFWIGDKYQDGKVTVHYRKLYDFFDEQGINIFIIPRTDNCLEELMFEGVIYNNGTLIKSGVEALYNVRASLENVTFLRAFQILEEKLREGR